jgi:hypothetical protein
MVMMMNTLEKVEIPLAVIPAEFPPPIFSTAATVLVFLSFCDALLPRTLRDHIYSDFLGKIRWFAKELGKTGDRRLNVGGWRGQEVGPRHLCSFGPRASPGVLQKPMLFLPMKNNALKISGQLDSVYVPESEKYSK